MDTNLDTVTPDTDSLANALVKTVALTAASALTSVLITTVVVGALSKYADHKSKKAAKTAPTTEED